MRITKENSGLRVHAVAGTYVVMFGFDLPEADCEGLLGFSIHRTDHTEGESYFLTGMKAFAETDPGFPRGAHYPTSHHPIQSFQWADYSAKPGHDYSYRIMARKGTPASLQTHAEVTVRIRTESPETGDHDVYFNRGVAASQEYARRFGNRPPEEVANGAAFEWLSRGLYEALEAFVRSARPGKDALRVAAYEFNYPPVLALLGDARARGVDVRISYDGRIGGSKPGEKNRQAVRSAGLEDVSVPRTRPSAAISHNKFIVRLNEGRAEAVWTGGTNFSEGGIYGHSNVAHVVEDAEVAGRYLEYWNALAEDPEDAVLTARVEEISPLPRRLAKGTTPVFSPRGALDALNWYAQLASGAKEGLMMTFAFGMNALFQDVYRTASAPFRLALLEKATGPMKAGSPERAAEERKIQELRNLPGNVFAIGDFIPTNAIDGWVQERLSGLNRNVKYVHNKFMLIDPLGADPIVVAGSANFSKASTINNDENMIVVRGNKRVADIYLGEFMRLWSHHSFRESLKWRDALDGPKSLRTDDWWRDSFGATERSTRRRFFARS